MLVVFAGIPYTHMEAAMNGILTLVLESSVPAVCSRNEASANWCFINACLIYRVRSELDRVSNLERYKWYVLIQNPLCIW